MISMRHGVTVTKVRHNEADDTDILMVKKPVVKYSMDSLKTQRYVTAVTKKTEGLKLNEPCDFSKKQEAEYDIKRLSVDKRSGERLGQNLAVTVRLSVDEDEGLDVGDSNSDLYTADTHDAGVEGNDKPKTNMVGKVDKYHLRVDNEESSVEDSDTDNVEFTLSSEAEGTSSEQVKHSTEKGSKKKRNLHSLLPALKRSQSLGCDANNANEESGIPKEDVVKQTTRVSEFEGTI